MSTDREINILVSGAVGVLIGVLLTFSYFSVKVNFDCTTKYLTTFGNANYMCAYVGTVEQRKAWLESHNIVEE